MLHFGFRPELSQKTAKHWRWPHHWKGGCSLTFGGCKHPFPAGFHNTMAPRGFSTLLSHPFSCHSLPLQCSCFPGSLPDIFLFSLFTMPHLVPLAPSLFLSLCLCLPLYKHSSLWVLLSAQSPCPLPHSAPAPTLHACSLLCQWLLLPGDLQQPS